MLSDEAAHVSVGVLETPVAPFEGVIGDGAEGGTVSTEKDLETVKPMFPT